jgi:hypothetical protein
MRKTPAVFKENFHVNPEQFDYLLSLLEAKLTPRLETRPGETITAEEKLCITLE